MPNTEIPNFTVKIKDSNDINRYLHLRSLSWSVGDMTQFDSGAWNSGYLKDNSGGFYLTVDATDRAAAMINQKPDNVWVLRLQGGVASFSKNDATYYLCCDSRNNLTVSTNAGDAVTITVIPV